jgi:hypothetical protein
MSTMSSVYQLATVPVIQYDKMTAIAVRAVLIREIIEQLAAAAVAVLICD